MDQNDINNWRNRFDERQLKEIDFSILYAEQFHHGTDGHNAKLIIARMASLLDFFTTGKGYEINSGQGVPVAEA